MQHSTRYSKKREAILSALSATTCHPTAEWLYQTLKSQHPDLSLATVYRNLSQFKAQGTIKSVGVIGGQEHFDASTAPHNHFICHCCHAIIDLPVGPKNIELDDAVAQEYGLEIDGHELMFYGRCPTCMSEQSKH